MSEDMVNLTAKYIQKKLKQRQYDYVNLTFFGGEPLLFAEKNVLPLLNKIKKICEQHKTPLYPFFVTNGSLLTENLVLKLKLYCPLFQITLDGNKEKHNKVRNVNGAPSYDKIIENVNLLCENVDNIEIILRINYDKQTLKHNAGNLLQDIKEGNREKIKIDLQQVWQTVQKKENQSIGNNQDVSLFVQNTKYEGYSIYCTGGLSVCRFHNCYVSRYNFISVNFDGKIYKCTARGYSDDYVFGEFLDNGTIKWDVCKLSKLYANATFENPMCINCVYLPLCFGPCPQKIVETPEQFLDNICVMKLTEQSVKDNIIDLYELSLKKVCKK